MKIKTSFFAFCAALAALFFAGCGKSDQPADNSGAGSSGAAKSAAAAPTNGRAIEVNANDQMKFNVTEIHAKPGEALAVTLTNIGTVPKFSMGHNWVLLKEGTDVAAFATDAMTAAATEYIPASFKASILASTKLLGPKETDTIVFNAPTKPGQYPFLCSFPGHMQVGMKGVLIVE